MWCPKISSSRSLCKGPVLGPAKNEEVYGIVPYQKIFSCHVTLLLKRKLQHLSHKCVICGSHPDCSVGQWVNRCDSLSNLMQITSHCNLLSQYSNLASVLCDYITIDPSHCYSYISKVNCR